MKIPEGVSLKIEGNAIVATGSKGSASKSFNPKAVSVAVNGGELEVKTVTKKLTRKANAAVKAIEAHARELCNGVVKGFEKKLTVIYAHFPITIEVKGNKVLIKNFLGEKSNRTAGIVGSTQVKADKQEITVSGNNKEDVGQTAANIVQATRVTKRDRRVFQDGVYYSQ